MLYTQIYYEKQATCPQWKSRRKTLRSMPRVAVLSRRFSLGSRDSIVLFPFVIPITEYGQSINSFIINVISRSVRIIIPKARDRLLCEEQSERCLTKEYFSQRTQVLHLPLECSNFSRMLLRYIMFHHY